MTEKTLKDAAGRVDRMADARGIDLQEVAMRAGLVPDDLAGMVQRCAGCTHPDQCDAWLDGLEGRVVSATPGYCRNADVFADLARR